VCCKATKPITPFEVVAASKVEHFLNGEMTVRQAETVAKKTRTPFGFLFLTNPPHIEEPSIPDLRQLPHPEPLSQLVIARRALDLGFIEWEEYQAEAARKASSPGGNPYATIPIRNSRKLTQAVIRSSRSGELMLREAGRLLNVNPATVAELARRSVENA
jgi:hypothetical protein